MGGGTNTIHMTLHILDMMRRIDPEGLRYQVGVYESKLKVQLRKYYDESRRLVEGFMGKEINPNEKVSVIESVLFHLENSPFIIMFYGTPREQKLLREAIAAYRVASSTTSINIKWEERRTLLEDVMKKYHSIKLMKDVLQRLPKLDLTIEGVNAREDAQEIARIALQRMKKIVRNGKSQLELDLMREIDEYLFPIDTDFVERLRKIINLWERYKTPRIM
jgi:hypothetical protein